MKLPSFYKASKLKKKQGLFPKSTKEKEKNVFHLGETSVTIM